MTISTLNMLGFSEINFLAGELTPSECFQLYNVSRGWHLKVRLGYTFYLSFIALNFLWNFCF